MNYLAFLTYIVWKSNRLINQREIEPREIS